MTPNMAKALEDPLNDYHRAIQALDSVRAALLGSSTGPWTSSGLPFMRWLDGAEHAAVAFRAAVSNAAARHVSCLESPWALSEIERARLLAGLPTINDDAPTFVRKAEAAANRLRELRAQDSSPRPVPRAV